MNEDRVLRRLDKLESQLKSLTEENERARAHIQVMHRTYHAGVADCPCREVLLSRGQ
jgi:hypothetical protein